MSGDAPAPLSRRRRALYLVAALTITAMVAALVLEATIRYVAPQPGPMRWLQPDPRYGHVMRPNANERYSFEGTDFVMEVNTNSLGLRDTELRAARDNEQTVLFLGDSVTFGHALNVDQRFDTLLDIQLAEAGRSYRLINAGVNAWGTLQATRYAADHFDTFDPDVIVLTFTGNDPSDDAYFLEKGQSFDVVRFPGKRFLRDHSHLYRLATHYAFVIYHSLTTKRQSRAEADTPIDKQSGHVISEEQWTATHTILRNFRDAFLAHSPEGAILLQPSAPKEEHIRAHLQTICNELGFVFIDMSAHVRDIPAADLRLPYDGHWSPLMHKISAEKLFGALSERDATEIQQPL